MAQHEPRQDDLEMLTDSLSMLTSQRLGLIDVNELQRILTLAEGIGVQQSVVNMAKHRLRQALKRKQTLMTAASQARRIAGNGCTVGPSTLTSNPVAPVVDGVTDTVAHVVGVPVAPVVVGLVVPATPIDSPAGHVVAKPRPVALHTAVYLPTPAASHTRWRATEAVSGEFEDDWFERERQRAARAKQLAVERELDVRERSYPGEALMGLMH